MPVNIHDIARKAGLSVVTVSRVINNYPSVREVNREKVFLAMRELDYKPNAAAQSLARGSTGTIGLVAPSMSDSFESRIVASVESALRLKDMFMVLSIAGGGGDVIENAAMRLFQENRVDGILIMSPVGNGSYIMELKRKDFPFVLLDQYQSNLQVPSVTVDNYYGGYQATLALIRGGAKRIAHISGAGVFESSHERLRGYRKALEDHKLEIDDELVVPGDFSVEGGYNVMRGWIRKGIVPDAVFAADDNTAFGVIDAARESGIEIPRKLAVIGYDDHPFASLFHPGISTVRQPAEAMGAYGVEMLLDILGGKTKRISKMSLNPRLMLRETTMPV